MKHITSVIILLSLAMVASGCQKKPEITEQSAVESIQNLDDSRLFKERLNKTINWGVAGGRDEHRSVNGANRRAQ